MMMMTTEMAYNFGYDSFGNCPSLLAQADRDVIDAGIQRASGVMICKCGNAYYQHPPVQGCLWVTRTCQGLFKL